MNYFVHPQGICESTSVGDGTRIWAFAHVLPGARIGRDCNVCAHTFIENDVVVGDRVTIKSGVQLWDGLRIGDDVFIGPNATLTNDLWPRSKQYPEKFLETFVERGASIGANATILPGLRIGQHAMVGAGAVVTRSVPPNAIVRGNPARIVGYVDSRRKPAAVRRAEDLFDESRRVVETGVGRVTLHRQVRIDDMRGALTVGVMPGDVPFVPKRYFIIYDVPSAEIRGEHALKTCQQFLLCTHGSCSVVVDDGVHREEFALDDPTLGLYLPPMTWGVQYKYSRDAVLLVLASELYDPDDYIRDYEEFLAEKRRAGA